MNWFDMLWSLLSGRDSQLLRDDHHRLDDHERRINLLERQHEARVAIRRVADGSDK